MANMTTTQFTNVTDSISKYLGDINANLLSTSLSSYNTSFTGTGASNTLGRVLALADVTAELALLSPMNTVAANTAAYLTGVQSLNSFYLQLFPFLNALDNYIVNTLGVAGGTNAYLTTNTLQVNAYFANAFNYFQAQCIGQNLRTSTTQPTAISAANFFPYAAVDPMFSFNCGAGTTMSSSTDGSASSSQGGGSGTIYLYKSNASNAAGGATFTITYTNTAGANVTTTYSTVSGTPTASGTLASGSVTLGVAAQDIISVTGTGMTSGENYAIGMKLVRAAAY